MPNPRNKVRLVEKADRTSPAPRPNIDPRLICLTAAGLRPLPSRVRGVFASREWVYGVLLKSAAGDASLRMMDEGWRKGREAVRPKATRTGRLKAVREIGADTDLAIEGNEEVERRRGRRIMIAMCCEVSWGADDQDLQAVEAGNRPEILSGHFLQKIWRIRE